MRQITRERTICESVRIVNDQTPARLGTLAPYDSIGRFEIDPSQLQKRDDRARQV